MDNNAKKVIEVHRRNGVGFLSILTIIFVIAKITGYINWSWWLVFVPFWGPIALVAAILAAIFLGAFASSALIVLANKFLGAFQGLKDKFNEWKNGKNAQQAE